jgi:uncharacterized protein
MAPSVYPFESKHGRHLFVVDGSRIYDIDDRIENEIRAAQGQGDHAIEDLLARYGLSEHPHIEDAPLQDPPMRALSLAVAQTCNLACAYCYAQGGDFGGAAKTMHWPVARDAVLRLLDGAAAGDRVNLAFLGGEPLVNRPLIRQVTEFASAEAHARGAEVSFSVTTNGTLLRPDDGEFFERHGFAVTVSIDGIGEVHNRLRPFRHGQGSYQRIIDRVRPLLESQHCMQVSARITVTPANLGLRETLDHLIDLGFHSVGFAPMLKGRKHSLEMAEADLDAMLDEMIACGRNFETATVAGRRYPFSNMIEALHQIHRGAHRPYPCGAGAGYFGVSADGGLFACHRFVEDPLGKLGDVERGVDSGKRNAWLAERHVHQQEPCTGCWARYLCGGGCHHEVIHRGRTACDFIRGWLHYCLTAYVNVMEQRPDYFHAPGGRI